MTPQQRQRVPPPPPPSSSSERAKNQVLNIPGDPSQTSQSQEDIPLSKSFLRELVESLQPEFNSRSSPCRLGYGGLDYVMGRVALNTAREEAAAFSNFDGRQQDTAFLQARPVDQLVSRNITKTARTQPNYNMEEQHNLSHKMNNIPTPTIYETPDPLAETSRTRIFNTTPRNRTRAVVYSATSSTTTPYEEEEILVTTPYEEEEEPFSIAQDSLFLFQIARELKL
ncbi:unnamed protein product [Amoebophrya sp. A25]|nr:unnamed protein product [Amoebophrya sp. A25]|eukprot:GSA25T00002596001.1